MKLENNLNYCILSNKIDKNLLDKFNEYIIIDDTISFEELKTKIEEFKNKTIVFNEVWQSLNKNRVKKILDLLNLRHINFINITSNIEEALLSDYIYVYDEEKIVMEGAKEAVLKEEKILKRLGFGLPFVVDLSLQLMYYGVLDKVYYDTESLVNKLWN